MLIVCPSCASEYMIDPARIGADGRTVRCASCRETFFVAGEPELTEEELAETEEFNTFLAGQPTAWPGSQPALLGDAESGRSDPEAAERPAKRRTVLPAAALAALASRIAAVPRTPLLALAVAALAAGAVLGREPIVKGFPAAARLYAAVGLPVNPLGLDLKGVRSELVMSGSDQFLVVEGEILNLRGRELDVPPLRLSVRGAGGLALYTWTSEPPRKTLGPAETARFRARLASPPADGREVLVRFAQAAPGATVAATAP
ncbi:MAG TPA: zinc-ribbon domain-containing protein [Beijerinckiaceae bacterium]|jgi:predicted Zn finger-like uncharacterized protein